MNLIESKYGKIFCEYVKNMLDEKQKNRQKCSEIFAELYPYEIEIL